MKCHKDHVDREEACITMCNGKCPNFGIKNPFTVNSLLTDTFLKTVPPNTKVFLRGL